MPTMPSWQELPQILRAPGISIKWIGSDDEVWHLSGWNEGAEGAFLSGPVKGILGVPFKSIWHEPAYGAPRFERIVDERREVSLRIAICSDTEFGWANADSRFWRGMSGDKAGYLSVFTRSTGELWIPMLLAESVQNDLTEDPRYSASDNVMEYDVLLAADGEPRWRAPDLRPPEWVNAFAAPDYLKPIRSIKIKQDETKKAREITVGVGQFKVANRGDVPAWPVYTVTAPGRCWLPDGVSGRMVRVPPLAKGEHIIVDTNPEHRIAISSLDPVDSWTKQVLRNSELLSWLFGQYGESGVSVLERFHGQGFTQPIAPGEVATLPVYHDTKNARVSVRLPQRYDRVIS